MNAYFLKDDGLKKFLASMMAEKTVYGPVAKKAISPKGTVTKFIFSKLTNPDDIRLDYDVTMIPPKKVFFPQCQPLVKFDGKDYSGCVDVAEKVLFGVHFYDIKAIDQTDYLFKENNADINYLTPRDATTIVGSNIQTVSPRSFWGTVGKDVAPKGHDAFLTKIDNGYVFDVRTNKGEALVKHGDFIKATDEQVKRAKTVNEKIMGECREKLEGTTKDIATKVRNAFGDEKFWEEASKDCFSCGSCNTTCPTCYCFDVQDKWNLDQKSGTRMRYWDSCLTEDFSKVSLGGGATENFREERSERFRHRFMRKMTYLNPKLGGPACVGCGRCSTACTADIADPVNVVNKIKA